MRSLVLTLLLVGCGAEVSVVPDMDEPIPMDLSNDIQPGEPSGGLGPGGLKLPPCARPEIDQCLGPPARSDVLKRPIQEMEMDTK